jgi:aromatic-L-amino-acid decarboxylase
LVKDPDSLRDTFGHEEAYIPHQDTSSHPVDYTLEYSRPLRALKLWMAFVAHGAGVLREAIDDNVGLAQLTYQQATAANDFETLGTPPDLSIVPLRYIPENVSDRSSFTSELAKRLVADGRIYISPATIDGQTWLRPCFTNFRTTADDVTVMFDVIREVGAQLAQES